MLNVFKYLLGAAASIAFIALFSFIPPKDSDAAARRELYFSKTHNFASLVDAAGETAVVTASGAALGDACVASVGVDLVDMSMTCYVQAANLVEVRLQNESGSTVDLASTTLRVVLFKTPQF